MRKTFESSNKIYRGTRKTIPYGSFQICDESVNILYKQDKDSEPEMCQFCIKIMKKRLIDTLQELDFTLYKDNDVFFLKKSNLTFEDFEKLKKEQKTRINFEQFGYEIIKILKKSQEKESECMVVLEESKTLNECFLTFTQTIDLKNVEILTLTFNEADEELKMAHANNLFKLMKKKIEEKERERDLFNKVLREKDPIVYELHFRNV